jgi:hypothetical protein
MFTEFFVDFCVEVAQPQVHGHDLVFYVKSLLFEWLSMVKMFWKVQVVFWAVQLTTSKERFM